MPERFEIKRSTDNQFYFVIIAPNNKDIGTSEMYTTKEACARADGASVQEQPLFFLGLKA